MAWLRRSPETATADDLRSFRWHLADTAVSATRRNRCITGVRLQFRITLHALDVLPEMHHVTSPQKLSLTADVTSKAWNRLCAEAGRIASLSSYPWIMRVKP